MSLASSFFAHPHQAFTAGFYRNESFDFELRVVLGQATFGAADTGEVLSAIAHVGEKDLEGWYEAWFDLGTRVFGQADEAAEAGHSRSASNAYLRAASYFGVAINAVDGLSDDSVLVPTFKRHRQAWDRFVDTTSQPVERVRIPYEDTYLPGYFFRPPGDVRRPTLIMVNGSDGPISGLWGSGGAGALERGYNVLMFDGPGQQSMLFERNIPFRHDWEAVITPVVDYLVDRPDVDASKLAMYGISQGGYWVPQSLAFEHRIAAAIADPGVVDVAASWLAHIPKNMQKLLDDGKSEAFDRDMAIGLGMKFSKDSARIWRFRARPYLADGYYNTLAEVRKYHLEHVAGSISTPLLITDPEGEQFWPGQSKRLAALAGGPTTVVPFTAAEGANFHCQPMARRLTDQRMFDWLDEQLDL
ncbi:alpha/beta hydrolase family protein [Rhodococcus qingshengii]|uniref:alpha/beta hydrolase family protein n=1 Tax=Rhodococcus qingshengii TaxID=334542 RepID=UPI0021B10A1A|nr:prolyl oligopeptidase family serine peptidase [Rhodococcus qingshengii]MCT6732612.1 prolyl oligopeptidase family serine peptidase [Rhodococcus qingshengii]MDJ0432594.1 prolyl oligopeptidase family serine peptidase [Rhodococcus qingshengii]